MGLAFLYNEFLVAVFIVGIPFGIAWLLTRLPGRLTAWGVTLGALLGVVVSWFFHPAAASEQMSLLRYLLDAINSCGVLATEALNTLSREILKVMLHLTGTSKVIAENDSWLNHRDYLRPMLLPTSLAAIIGGIIAWLIAQRKPGNGGAGAALRMAP